MEQLRVIVEMPGWLQELESEYSGKAMPGDHAKLEFAVMLAGANVRHGTGGPFGAAIFDLKSDCLIAAGVNLVVAAKQSWVHAEMTAISNAQKRLGTASLRGCVLVSSCEPCAMCFGAVPWSGVEMLIYGAPGSYAREIGFDEGDKVADWHGALEKRGIKVIGPMPGDMINEPFLNYRKTAGKIY